jgi:hypothetical protein
MNFYGWVFGLAAIVVIPANVVVQMYVVFHPNFVIQVCFRRSKRATFLGMTAHEPSSAVAYFSGFRPHQLVLLPNRDILQPVPAHVAEIWAVHSRRWGFGHHYRTFLWLLLPRPWLTRRVGSSGRQFPRIPLICLH